MHDGSLHQKKKTHKNFTGFEGFVEVVEKVRGIILHVFSITVTDMTFYCAVHRHHSGRNREVHVGPSTILHFNTRPVAKFDKALICNLPHSPTLRQTGRKALSSSPSHGTAAASRRALDTDHIAPRDKDDHRWFLSNFTASHYRHAGTKRAVSG